MKSIWINRAICIVLVISTFSILYYVAALVYVVQTEEAHWGHRKAVVLKIEGSKERLQKFQCRYMYLHEVNSEGVEIYKPKSLHTMLLDEFIFFDTEVLY